MIEITRTAALKYGGMVTFFCAAVAFATMPVVAAEMKSVKIGYAVSKTGINAAGAGITTIPNYVLWAKDVHDAGGLEMPDGSRLPIEVIEYDDRSDTAGAVRAIERLATKDKVHFILPPWGTGFNLAVAPLMDRFGYPQLAVTAATDKADEFVKRWKKSFWFLGGGRDYSSALAKLLAASSNAGKMNKKVAMVSVAAGFGIELATAARKALAANGLDLVFDKTYPLGTKDFAAMLNKAKTSGADTFVAFSYPAGTFSMSKTAKVASYNPKVFYVGVGGAFPVYAKIIGDNIDGVMGIGGVNANTPAMRDYFTRHEAVTGAKPDSWASAVTYASLQVLQQAIMRVGLDRDAVSAEISTGTFDTIIGEIKMERNQLRNLLWFAGQWQNGVFAAIAPTDAEGASAAVIPKPAWR